MTAKLTDLNANFVYWGGEGVTDKDDNPVPRREGVGMCFDCPCGCGDRMYVAFTNPMDGGEVASPRQASWQRYGDDIATMTLRPSVLRKDGCGWHGYITDGEAREV